jgi:alpha-beta hydrolase superfamily lysophospholipase
MNEFDYKVRSKEFEGLKLCNYEYPTKYIPKALLLYVPGFGETALYKGYFFKKFADNGIRTFAFDRRGFGLSEGKRG